MNSFSRNDEPHGDLGVLYRKVKKARNDPRSDKRKGIFLVPELTNVNVLYWHFAAEIAFEGTNLTPERFMEGYGLKRYNSKKQWRNALVHFIAAAHTDFDVSAYENVVGYEGGRLPAVPYLSGWYNKYYYQAKRLLPADKTQNEIGMRDQYFDKAKSMHTMLKFVIDPGTEDISSIEVNDLITSLRFFCGMVSNAALFNMYFARKAGKIEDFEDSASMVLTAVEGVYRILSHREEYSLEKMIREILSVPGTNPYSAEMIKATSMNIDYNANEVYEQIVFYYLPRLHRYIDWLRGKLNTAGSVVDLTELETDDINESWIRHPINVRNSPAKCWDYYHECKDVFNMITALLPVLGKISSKYSRIKENEEMGSGDNLWAGTE